MIKEEWKYLLKHKLIMIVFTVMIFIPSIYSVTFLKSMWDPYGELKNLPVAVVNNDKSVSYQGTELKIGKDLAKNLDKSQAMDFHVLKSRTAANKGLTDGKYYMIITIPKDFSKNATTLLNKQPKKMVLNYETSAGHNFTASKMTASAAQQAAQSVSEQGTKTYSKTMFNSIKQVSKGMKTAANGSKKLAVGNTKVESANQQITTGLNTLSSSSLTFSNGAKTLNQGLDQYISGVNQVANGSQTLTNELQQLNNKSMTLASGVDQLTNGSNSLTSGIESYTSGVDSVNSAASSLNSGANTLTSGTDQLSNSSIVLNTGLGQLQTASQELTTNLQKVSAGLNGSTAQLAGSIDNLQSQLANNNTNQATAIKSDLTNLQQAISNQNNNSTNTATKVAQVADQQGLTATQKDAILGAVTNSNDDSLNQAATALSTDLNNLTNTQAGMTNQINNLQGSLNDSQTNLSTTIAQLAAGSEQLTTQLETATNGMNQLNTGIGAINANTAKLAQGTNQLSAGTNQLASNSFSLTNGANTLNSGISSMNTQMPSLTAGVGQLASGANTLNSGISQLVTTGSQLTNGANQLNSGADQIASGAQTLATGSTQMGSGIGQVTDGNNTLAKQLAAGAQKSNIKATNLTYDQIAKPTTTKHKERDTAPNNGTGMAPYMLSVSLFVGALAFNLMFDIYTPRKFPKTGIAWWASKATVTGTFVVGESLAVFALLCAIDGLAPVQTFATFIMLLLTGLTFMSIVYWLNLVLGKVGSFLSMILLVFQLGSSAGTYPIQLSNHFFNAIHPWLPMSYTVDGLRQTLMIGDSAIPDMMILLEVTLVFSFMSILFFIRRKTHIKEIDFTKESAEHSLT